MDLNQLYFDHQLLLMKAQGARDERHEALRAKASGVAAKIARSQSDLGATAEPQWRRLAGA